MATSSKTIPNELRQPMIDFLLCVADEKFFLGHRNSDWTGLGPFLEEDIAFCNIAQDEIAHAQELYKLAAALTAPDRDLTVETNRLAYARPATQRLAANVVVLVDEYDWAVAIARQFFFDHYDRVRLPGLQKSAYTPLAELAGKMILEVSFHTEHFDDWVGKLGKGTADSKTRLQQAVDKLWPEALGLFEPLPDQAQLVSAGIAPGEPDELCREWLAGVGGVLRAAGITVPSQKTHQGPGGRQGRHSPDLDQLLTDLVEVYNCEPEASW